MAAGTCSLLRARELETTAPTSALVGRIQRSCAPCRSLRADVDRGDGEPVGPPPGRALVERLDARRPGAPRACASATRSSAPPRWSPSVLNAAVQARSAAASTPEARLVVDNQPVSLDMRDAGQRADELGDGRSDGRHGSVSCGVRPHRSPQRRPSRINGRASPPSGRRSRPSARRGPSHPGGELPTVAGSWSWGGPPGRRTTR